MFLIKTGLSGVFVISFVITLFLYEETDFFVHTSRKIFSLSNSEKKSLFYLQKWFSN